VGETQLRLWPFSLAVYHDNDVQKECLDLQDRHGIDVNMLLFCAFVGAVHGAIISEHDVRDALSLIGAWNANVWCARYDRSGASSSCSPLIRRLSKSQPGNCEHP
jgi:uncharacterized protein (TIGR02444 family)